MKIQSLSLRSQAMILSAAVIIVRLVLAWIFGSEVADISQFHDMANIIARAENIYKTPGLFHYTPIAMFLPFWCLKLSEFIGLPFHFVIKWPTILAEVGIALLLWQQTLKNGNMKGAMLIGLAYAFNPVSLLITAFHGSYNIIQVFFSLLAYLLVINDSEKRYYRLSALSLGIAIGFRGFPVLFVPFFLRKINLDWRRKFFYLFLAALPSVVTLIPFLIADFQSVWQNMFSYSGMTDYGWVAVARSYWFVVDGNRYLPGTLGNELLAYSKWMFLILYTLFTAYFWWKPQRFSLLSGIVAATLMFFGIYGGISSQYLVWLVPFALLVGTFWEKAYTWTAAAALVGFYLFYFPAILFGSLSVRWPEFNPAVMSFTLPSGFVFWGVCVIWLIRMVRYPTPEVSVQKPQAARVPLEAAAP